MKDLTVVVVASFMLLQANLVVSDDISNEPNCLSDGCEEDIQKLKEACAFQIGANVTGFQVSKFIAGNQCWNCDRIQWVNRRLSSRPKRQAYNFTADPLRRWPLPISYMFNSSVPSSNSPVGSNARTIVRGALSHIEALTCIRFNEVSLPLTTSYISFGSSSSCVSFVGRTLGTISGPIFATVDCLTDFGQMVYLVAQTLGLFHQSQRYDRDTYVTVVSDNVRPENQGDLMIISQSWQLLDTFGLPYDLASVMHFSSKAFTRNGNYTIVTKDPLYNRTIGQRVQLSFQDAKLLNLMYCSGTCSSQSLMKPCQNGGYQNPNNCSMCQCPDGYAGQYCSELERAQGASCGGVLSVTANEQIITSPGYDSPGYYDSQVKCIWNLTASAGQRIMIRFLGDFGVYCNDESCYHWVEVRLNDKQNETGPRFCCHQPPSQLISSGNQVMIIFQSNISDISSSFRRGFKLGYSIAANSSPCDPNPCRNGGICKISSSTNFTCTCPIGLTGPLCQRGYCGGCNLKPGQQELPCIINEYPLRMCNVTRVTYGSDSSSDDSADSRRFKLYPKSSESSRTITVQEPCKKEVCCENARMIGISKVSAACTVTGWTGWSFCSVACGGGYQIKLFYDVQERTFNGNFCRIPVVTNSTSQVCNTVSCTCPTRRFFGNCRACNNGFILQGTTCLPLSMG